MAATQLKLYVNPTWRRDLLHTPLLNPWWGSGQETLLAKQMFDTYAFDTRCYTITDDIQTADMVLAPYRHDRLLKFDKELLTECDRVARSAGLPLLLDGTGDVEYPVNREHTYILRYGGYRFLPERGKIQIPPLANDLLELYREGKFTIREKREGKPVVGFAGWTKLSFVQSLRTIIKELPVRVHGIFDVRYRTCTKGIWWRRKAIKILRHSSRIVFNLRARSSFSANPKTAEGDVHELREEMVSIIVDSDYALDVRGDSNASTRLFEILSLGRIPVIVDTERNFPFSGKVDYASFALIVDFRDIKKLPEKIAEFHKNVSPERYEQMQRNARDAYVNYFRIDALMPLIVEELRK